MSNAPWKLVRELFDAAVDLPIEDRKRFLQERCAGNPTLRFEVESLLAHEAAGRDTFLAAPVGAPPDLLAAKSADPHRMIGERIGRYHLQGIIGLGGMSVVYLATQERPARKVAVKIMNSGLLSRTALRRFEFEVETLARLRHPNIAQIFEAGTCSSADRTPHQEGSHATAGTLPPASAVPYFVMEYVDSSLTITQYADRNRLNLRRRVELFLQVCNGVHHGHSRGVIHRDLKPDNILVSVESTQSNAGAAIHPDSPVDGPMVKVIDFGIARSVERDSPHTTIRTELNQLMGTLQYMSPEQFAADPADIDVRTDVYSLGVILYELLCGRLPYDLRHTTLTAAMKAVCESEPPAPCTVTGRGKRQSEPVRGDLERVILRSLEKNRDRRYTGVSELSKDLLAWLRGDPVSVRRPTPLSRAWHWIKRHPKSSTAVAASLLWAIIIVAGFLYGTKLFLRWKQTPVRVQILRQNSRLDRYDQPVKSGDQVSIFRDDASLKSWFTNKTEGIRLAAAPDRPAQFGGGQIVIIGAEDDNLLPSFISRKLCAFSPDGPYDEPLWPPTMIQQRVLAHMNYEDWPRPLTVEGRKRIYDAESFFFCAGDVIDIFPESEYPQCPGSEIIAIFQHREATQTALEILNLKGEPLFHVWMDMSVGYFFGWLPQSRLLVMSGMKGDRYLWEYKAMNGFVPEGDERDRVHLRVLFAIRPEPGVISKKWIHPYPPGAFPRTPDDPWRGDWYKPVWFRALCPPATSASCEPLHFRVRRANLPEKERVQITLNFPSYATDGYPLTLTMNAAGEIQPDELAQNSRTIQLQVDDKDHRLPTEHTLKFLLWDENDPEPPCD